MKELNFKQELTAAFGQPISENPTQVMVEAAYRPPQARLEVFDHRGWAG